MVLQRNSRLFRTGLVALLLMVLLAALTTVQAQAALGTVNTASTLIHTRPGINHRGIIDVSQGRRLEVVGRNADGSWLQVRVPGTNNLGWVNAGHITLAIDVMTLPQTAATGRWSAFVKASVLNVRKGPGANFDVVVRLLVGQTMNVTGRNADSSWVQVEVPGIASGWVSRRYVSLNFDYRLLPEVSATGVNEGFEPPIPTSNTQVAFIIAVPGANVRYGPGNQYDLMTVLGTGEGVYLRGRNSPGTWLFVQLDNGDAGWIRADLVSTTFPILDLPIVGNS